MNAATAADATAADAAKMATDAATDVARMTADAAKAADAASEFDADGRFDDGLFEAESEFCETESVLTEEDMARATEVVVPAPYAASAPADVSADGGMPVGEASAPADEECRPVVYVSQQEFASAALMDVPGRRMSLGRVAAVSAAVGVAGVCAASVLTKEDASLSRAATPDDEKSADEIAANIGVGDDVERVEVPAAPHVSVTYEDMTADAASAACNSDAACGAEYAGADDMSAGFDDIYDTLG